MQILFNEIPIFPDYLALNCRKLLLASSLRQDVATSTSQSTRRLIPLLLQGVLARPCELIIVLPFGSGHFVYVFFALNRV